MTDKIFRSWKITCRTRLHFVAVLAVLCVVLDGMAVHADGRAMYRRDLAPGRGMLFDFGREIYISMWMRNTFISLDMLFIGADGRIGFIRERTTPQSLDTIEAPERNRAVLEVAAGTVARLGIRVGDRVDHAIFR